MADKPLQLVSGVLTQVEGTVTSAGAGNAGDIPALDGTGKFDASLLPSGVGADVQVVEATENLAAGDFVNIYDATGAKCRKADASSPAKYAVGHVKASVTSGQNATVYPTGTANDHVTGLTVGAEYYLSGSSAGVPTATAPSTAGHIVQALGTASAATVLPTNLARPVTLA
jgi:hypothetical protein